MGREEAELIAAIPEGGHVVERELELLVHPNATAQGR
jgi:hypothetical protein